MDAFRISDNITYGYTGVRSYILFNNIYIHFREQIGRPGVILCVTM